MELINSIPKKQSKFTYLEYLNRMDSSKMANLAGKAALGSAALYSVYKLLKKSKQPQSDSAIIEEKVFVIDKNSVKVGVYFS
jgi:hypothetical protein